MSSTSAAGARQAVAGWTGAEDAPSVHLYAERGLERTAALDTAGVYAQTSYHTSGMSVLCRAGDGSTRFGQCSGTSLERARRLLDRVLPASRAGAATAALTQAAALAATPASEGEREDDAVARQLLQAARDAATEAGGRDVTCQLWERVRCFTARDGRSMASQRVELRRLTVSVGHGPARVTRSVADLAHAPLSVTAAAAAGSQAAERWASLRQAAQPRSGTTAVLFAPSPAGVLLHEVFGHALEADTARTSVLWSRRASLAFHGALTLTDDVTHSDAWETVGVDDEGTPVRPAILITNGRVSGRLTDRRHAAAGDAPLTGHGRRGWYGSPPEPRMRHLAAAPGTDPAAAILADTRNGILVTDVHAADAVPGQGRFFLRVTGAREVIAGQPGRWLGGFTVRGTLDDLARLDAVGDEAVGSVAICGKRGRWLPVSHSAPVIRVPALSIGSGGA